MDRKSLKLFFLMALIGLFLLSACGSTSASSGTQGNTGKRYKIGFANLTEGISFTTQVRQGIEQAAKQAGNIDLVEANNNLDGATALANADNFITQQVDGVIEFQTDAKFGNVIMDKFRAHNIPVIAIDIPMPVPPSLARITTMQALLVVRGWDSGFRKTGTARLTRSSHSNSPNRVRSLPHVCRASGMGWSPL